jgi:hypothetical protein
VGPGGERVTGLLRLGDWDQLERGGAGVKAEAARAATAEKVAAIAQGRRRGSVDPAIAPSTLLGLLLAVCRTDPVGSAGPAAHRDAVVTTVRRIVGGSPEA